MSAVIGASFTHNQTACTDSPAVQLAAASTAVTPRRGQSMGVIVKALAANAGKVYVGSSSSVTTSNGYQLSAGESVTLPVDDPSRIYIIGSAATQTVCWICL